MTVTQMIQETVETMCDKYCKIPAEATIRAIVEEHPGLVMRVLSSEYIRNLAALEAMSGFMGRWKA